MAFADISARDLFRIIAPEFVSVPNDTVDLYIELAGQTTGATVFGNRFRQAVVYLAAHLLTLDNRGADGGPGAGTTGPVTSERAGEVQISYGHTLNTNGPAMDQMLLGQTNYGVRYLAIRRSLATNKPFTTQQHTPWPKP